MAGNMALSAMQMETLVQEAEVAKSKVCPVSVSVCVRCVFSLLLFNEKKLSLHFHPTVDPKVDDEVVASTDAV